MFIPDDWYTAAYDHTVTERKISRWGKRMWTCTCGMVSMIDTADLYEKHRKAEQEFIDWWHNLEETRLKREKLMENKRGVPHQRSKWLEH